jgi:hypothetical protein
MKLKNRLRNRNTIESLCIGEYLHNPDFNPVEYEGFKKEQEVEGRKLLR